MQCSAVHVRVNYDRGNSHLVARAQHAHRNLSSVGDENFLEHRGRPGESLEELTILQEIRNPWRDSPGSNEFI
jgi:hypothetical protein